MKYAVVVEKSKTGFAAYVPDLPGCIATARTRPQVLSRIREAIEFHLDGMREDELPVPKPSARVDYVAPRKRAG
jgi:predicted RNase H-like HicB family nuclease